VALADPAADAAPVPVIWSRILTGMAGLVLASGPQRPVLSYGLRAGRHDVAVRPGGPGKSSSVWYPAVCGRRRAAPAAPCRDAPPDTSRLPLLVLAGTGGAATAADTATAEYLASHGYVVAAVSEAGIVDHRRLPFVDTARTATARLRRGDTLLSAAASDWQLSVVRPPGPSDHIRLSAAVTLAFLDAALRVGPAALPDLTRRLTAAGLTVHLVRPGTGKTQRGR
jgi:hypothetical protein